MLYCTQLNNKRAPMHYTIELHSITSINYNPNMSEYTIHTDGGPIDDEAASKLLGVRVEERDCERDEGIYYFMLAN